MSGRVVLGAVLAWAVLLACGPAARAQGGGGSAAGPSSSKAPSGAGGPAQANQASTQARAHFEKGMRYFEQHAYREAIQQFHLAAEIVPSADLWFNIARAHEELSEYDAAVEYYRRYLRDRIEPPDKAQVERHIADLEQRIEEQRQAALRRPTTGTLRVGSEDRGARVSVDGKPVGTAPLAIPLTLAPGKHAFDVEKKGYIPMRAEVTMEPGVTTGAYADLSPKTEYRSIRGKRRWTWVATGLAAGALAAGAGLGIYALHLKNEGRLDDARRWSTNSDYALGSAMAVGVVAVILYFVEGRSRGTERVQTVGAR